MYLFNYTTLSARGQTLSVQTVSSGPTMLFRRSPSAGMFTRDAAQSTAIALNVGIPLLLITILIIIVGFTLHRRAVKSKKRGANIRRRRLQKMGQDRGKPEALCLSTSHEKYELAGDRPPQELPTSVNVPELPVAEPVVELPERSPVEIGQSFPVEIAPSSPVELE